MKEPQKSKIIALLMDYSAGVYQNKEMPNLIESILSPLPHQDGASAEEIWNIAQSILDKCRCEPIYTNRKMVDPNCAWCEYHVDFIQALDQFAKSESAKVVAEKDRVIYEREIEVLSLQADLLKSNARIERLEQGMANWVMVSNERQEELNEAKKRIEGLEEYKETMIIQHRLKTK